MASALQGLAVESTISPVYVVQLLRKSDLPRLTQILASGLKRAYARAVANAREKVRIRDKYKDLGEALSDTRLAPVEVQRDTVKAEYAIDPRQVCLDDKVRHVPEGAHAG